MNFLRKVYFVWVVLAIGLMVSVPTGAFGQSADIVVQIANQLIPSKNLEKVDCEMMARGYKLLELWKFWTDGICRPFKGSNGEGKIELVVNWDGKVYDRNNYKFLFRLSDLRDCPPDKIKPGAWMLFK